MQLVEVQVHNFLDVDILEQLDQHVWSQLLHYLYHDQFPLLHRSRKQFSGLLHYLLDSFVNQLLNSQVDLKNQLQILVG